MTYLSMFDIFTAWHQEAEKFACGEITKEEYDAWRYNYPAGKNRIKQKMPAERYLAFSGHFNVC